jgi:aspartate racemase
MLGGMSWESSAQYYRLANELVRERLGGLHSARVLLASVDFAEIEQLQTSGRWDEAGQLLAEAAKRLEAGGAELLLICTNTMHKVADQVQAAVHIPLLHLVDATAQAITQAGLSTVGLLGTAFTMEQDFTATDWPATASRCSCHLRTIERRCTASSTTSCAWVCCARSHGRSIATSSRAWSWRA